MMRWDGMGLDRIGWNEMRALLSLEINACMHLFVCLCVCIFNVYI